MTTANYFRVAFVLTVLLVGAIALPGDFALRDAQAQARRRRRRSECRARRACPRKRMANISPARAIASPATRRAAVNPSRAGSRCPRPSARSTRRTSRPIRRPGIGKWSADDFWKALHDGSSRDGSLLYPAFPYPSYTKITRADADAIYGYIWSLKPVRKRNTPHKMQFPVQPAQSAHRLARAVFRAGRVQAKSRTRQRNGIAARISCRASATATPATRAATCLAPR